MRTRQHHPSQHERPEPAPAAASGAEGARQRAQRLLDAGDDIIARALSGDSEQFLAENRQMGGQ